MFLIITIKTAFTLESTDWRKAVDGRDYTHVCPCHVDIAVALGFDGQKFEGETQSTGTRHTYSTDNDSIESFQNAFACEVCNGLLTGSLREWLLDAFSSDDAQEVIQGSNSSELIKLVSKHYDGGLAGFISDSCPR